MTAVPELRQPSGTGFALRDPLPWDDLAAIVRASEAAGYDALILPEITGRDAFVTLGALAGETQDLWLGSGVVPMRSRSLLLSAMAAATVQERSGGRLVLGLGTGDAGRGALGELRETVAGLRALLAGEAIDRPGWPGALALEPGTPVPIWISALGPRAMRLAGEVADGVLLNWCPPERVARARREIARGADATQRDPADVTVAVYVRACLGHDEEHALAVLAEAAEMYAAIPAYRRQLEAEGIEPSPEAMARVLCVWGDRDEALGRLAAWREAGADLVVVYPVPAQEAVSSLVGTIMAAAPDPAVER
jgi:5,10-methylenetetrahydromethanopterin reductase